MAITDGSENASGGAAQLPNLLNGYAVRPTWEVAGVDYAVGVHSGTTLKSPTTMNMSGVWVDTTNKVVGVFGDNVVLDGWNFTGWTVSVLSGADNTTVTNSNFTEGVLRYEPGSSNGTIKYNLFDQNDKQVATAPFIVFASGTFDVEYNHFQDSYHMHAQFTNGQPGQTVIFEHNLLENAGGGAPEGAHGDWIQFFGDYTVNDAQINYNTVVQDKSGFSTQGWMLGYDQLEVQSASISNNTMVVPDTPDASVNYAVILAKQWINGTVDVKDNYIDQGGVDGSFMQTYDSFPGPFDGTINTSNVVNMATGGYVYPPSGDTGGGTGTTAPATTAVSPDTGVAGDNITSDHTLTPTSDHTLTPTGTAAENSTVNVHDENTLLGQVATNGSGAGSDTVAALSNASHSLSAANVGDAGANTPSATSSADTIMGTGGNDTLRWMAGGDVLNGGAGRDTLAGGTSSDKFVFDGQSHSDAIAAVPHVDLVSDYNRGNSSAFSAAEGDQLPATASGSGPEVNKLVRVVDNGDGDGAFVQVDTDGTGNNSHGVTNAELDGIHRGGSGNAILSSSQPAGTTVTLQQGNHGLAGDFNGDGKDDLLWRNDSGVAADGQTNGTQLTSSAAVGGAGADWHVVDNGDFNADGKSDILWHTDGGTVSAWQQMNSGQLVSSAVDGGAESDWPSFVHHYDLV